MRILKEKPNTPRDTLIQEHFSSYGEALPDKLDQGWAFDLALKIIGMVRYTSRRIPLGSWGRGVEARVWKGNESVRKFILRTFPMTDVVDLGDEKGLLIRAQLRAVHLKRIHRFDFKGTDDLDRHLVLDRERKKTTILVYHHTAFLKEYLRSSTERESIDWYACA